MENKFEQHVEKELKSMDQRLEDLEEKMTSIDTKITQVVDAILGNPLTKSGGFVTDIETLKAEIKILKVKIEKQEDFKKRVTWSIAIIIVLAFILEYFTKLYIVLTK
jgi:hypothetical protein